MERENAIKQDDKFLCPKCRIELDYFVCSENPTICQMFGLGELREFLYCFTCMDIAYSEEGKFLIILTLPKSRMGKEKGGSDGEGRENL